LGWSTAGLRLWEPAIGRGAKGILVGVKIQNRTAGARFWPTKRGGIQFQAEKTLLGWRTPRLRLWGPVIGHHARGGAGWSQKPKIELPGLSFGE
jgi:hypothetical protein